MGHLVRVGAQRRELESRQLWFEGKRIDFDGIENVLTSEQRWEIVVNPGEQSIAAEFQGVALALKTESLGQMQAVLASPPRQDRRTAKTISYAVDFRERVIRIAGGTLQIVGELRTKVAE